jgi:hypothetical protein
MPCLKEYAEELHWSVNNSSSSTRLWYRRKGPAAYADVRFARLRITRIWRQQADSQARRQDMVLSTKRATAAIGSSTAAISSAVRLKG